MKAPGAFHLEDVLPETKAVYGLTVDSVGDMEGMEDEVLLNLCRLATRESIRAEMAERLREGNLSLPVLVARGAEPGQTLVVTAGVHGDEYEGIEAIYRIFDSLDVRRMRGGFMAVPVVNLPGFWQGVRSSPPDSLNPARVFPGAPDGSATERLAWELLQRVLRHASLYIDLHSAGRNYHMLTLCGYCTAGSQAVVAEQAARASGMPVVWAHPSVSPGRTISATLDLGIPSLYTEAYGGGHARAEEIADYTRCLANLLAFMGIADIPTPAPSDRETLFLSGSGDLDFAVNCSRGGFFVPRAALGEHLAKGRTLGIIRDLSGKVVEEIVSPEDGFVVIIRATPVVFGGEFIAALSEKLGTVASVGKS